ncbi:MAG: sigma-70 family RNA polymerase sigma factor [Myxococcales bacterium]|nr:sigma-70 family RNA polymerase sigma factor [Myxococcales bacterium]
MPAAYHPRVTFRERLLVRRLRDRDERAFRELIAAEQDRVFNLVYRMLGNRAEAEDVAQEVFVTVFKTIDQFRGESKLSTWLYRVAVNHCKNRLKYLARRHDRERADLEDAAYLPAAAGAGQAAHTARTATPERALAEAETERLVQREIAELDPEHREVVILRDLEELSYEEICVITGLPEGTVKSRLHRARLALRARLTKVLGG